MKKNDLSFPYKRRHAFWFFCILCTFLVLMTVSAEDVHARVSPSTGPPDEQIEYEPGALIIKLKDLGNGKLDDRFSPFKTQNDPDLDRIEALKTVAGFEKYNVEKIQRLFKDDLKASVTSSPGTKIAPTRDIANLNRKKFPRRARRAPPNAGIPELSQIYRIVLDDPDVDVVSFCQKAAADPGIAYCHPNYRVTLFFIPNDEYFGYQYSLHNTGADYPAPFGEFEPGTEDADMDLPEAWDIAQGGQEVIVAVLDTGVDYNHPDLTDNMWPGIGYGFLGDDHDPMDNGFHGTHVAGTIAATHNNGYGISGVAPTARIMAIAVLNYGPRNFFSVAAEGIYYAVNHGAEILSNSWGLYHAEAMQGAVDYAVSQGAIVVAAAGNFDTDASFYPAAYENVIAVAATDLSDRRSVWEPAASNYGTWIDVSAPGTDILSLMADNRNARDFFEMEGLQVPFDDPNPCCAILSGTSMATPHVSGLAALILSQHPDWSAEQVRSQILMTADNIDGQNPGFEGLLGTGRVNAYRALSEIHPRFALTDVRAVSVGSAGPGRERVQELTLGIKNVSSFDAEGVSLVLETNDPGIDIEENVFFLGSVASGIGLCPARPFRLRIDGSRELLRPADFLLSLTFNGNLSQEIRFSLQPDIVPEPLVTAGENQQKPTVYRKLVVWEDFRNGNWDIFGFDLAAGEEFSIANSPHDQRNPNLYGSRVVWEDRGEVYTWSLDTQSEQQLTSDGAEQVHPVVFEDKVVWIENGENPSVHLFDLASGEDHVLASNTFAKHDPAIHGHWVSWRETEGADYRCHCGLYARDLRLGFESEPLLVEDMSCCGDTQGTVIYQNKIYWEDRFIGSGSDIVFYDTETTEKVKLIFKPFEQLAVSIHGNRVVWQDDRNGNWDIYMYDLSSGLEIPLVLLPGNQTDPCIYGNTLVWVDDRRGEKDLFTATLPRHYFREVDYESVEGERLRFITA